ncbi:B-type lectin plumieribetin-like [Eucyclogobius newberryi]|uniref:B-type lectin plumieribetin-like n=1 Tax=Eucyclogobius newberryi TaxID=166745 RepID=UPI003B5A4896
MSKSSISTDQELRKGDYLLSNNGHHKAIFQEDGNFVLYKWTPVWASDTTNSDSHRLVLQSDGNLVMYSKDDAPVWSTDTCNPGVNSRMRLTVTDEGKLQLSNDSLVKYEAGRGKCCMSVSKNE